MSRNRIKVIAAAVFTAASLAGGTAAAVAPALTPGVVAMAPNSWYHM